MKGAKTLFLFIKDKNKECDIRKIVIRDLHLTCVCIFEVNKFSATRKHNIQWCYNPLDMMFVFQAAYISCPEASTGLSSSKITCPRPLNYNNSHHITIFKAEKP